MSEQTTLPDDFECAWPICDLAVWLGCVAPSPTCVPRQNPDG